MEWLSQNWIWLLVIGAVAAIHLFGHGRHGGQGKAAGGYGGCGARHAPADERRSKDRKQPEVDREGHWS